MILGFSGTRLGMTDQQKESLRRFLEKLQSDASDLEVHHGDCVGADTDTSVVRNRLWNCGGPGHRQGPLRYAGPNWVIVGGESGPGARACHVDHVRSIIRQCQGAGVPVFVKQLGDNALADYYKDRDFYENAGYDWPDPFNWDMRDGQPPLDSVVQLPLRAGKGGDPAGVARGSACATIPGGEAMNDELAELLAIKRLVEQFRPCAAQYVPFCDAIMKSDYLTAWQTLLGNYKWLIAKRIEVPNLEARSQGIAKRWHSNGQLAMLATYQNGQRHGVSQEWYSDGQLHYEILYQDGQQLGWRS